MRDVSKKLETSQFLIINRYTLGFETCKQAKTSKSGHAIFFSFFRRVRATSMTPHRVENTRGHFLTFLRTCISINQYRTEKKLAPGLQRLFGDGKAPFLNSPRNPALQHKKLSSTQRTLLSNT